MTKKSTLKIAFTLRSTFMMFLLLQSAKIPIVFHIFFAQSWLNFGLEVSKLYVKNGCKDCLPRRREASEIKLFPLTPKQW